VHLIREAAISQVHLIYKIDVDDQVIFDRSSELTKSDDLPIVVGHCQRGRQYLPAKIMVL